MDHLTVGVVASPRDWRSDLQSHVRDHVSDVQLKVLREPRTAFEQQMDVVVIDDVASFLSRANVERLRERGVRVVGVYDPSGDEGQGERFLDELGVDLTVTADATPEELLRTIAALGPGLELDADELDRFLENPDASTAPAPPAADTPTPKSARPLGRLITVGGAGGGAGITEVSLAIAGTLAAQGAVSIVLDLDAVGPTVARRLLYMLEPNILSVLDALRHKGGDLGALLGSRARGAPGSVSFHVVPGLANVTDWPELRPGDVAALIERLRKAGAEVVVDAGEFLEDLDANGRERFGAARTAVANADVLVGVCRPDPLGVLAFLDWAAYAHELGPERPLSVIVNRAPKSRFKRDQLEAQLRDNIAPELLAGVFFVADDPRLATAVWDGAPAGPGPFTRAISDVTRRMVPVVAGQGRRTKAKASR